MKYHSGHARRGFIQVTLCVRVWIEIDEVLQFRAVVIVTLCVRVWMEII